MRISNIVRRAEDNVLSYTQAVRREFVARAAYAELRAADKRRRLNMLRNVIDSGQLNDIRTVIEAVDRRLEDIS